MKQSFLQKHLKRWRKKSKQHSIAMFQAKDAAHIAAMESMKALMVDPSGMQQWMNNKRAEFLKLTDE